METKEKQPIHEQVKISKLAVVSLAVPLVLWPVIFYSARYAGTEFGHEALGYENAMFFTYLFPVACILLFSLNMTLGILALCRIKNSDGALKGRILAVCGLLFLPAFGGVFVIVGTIISIIHMFYTNW